MRKLLMKRMIKREIRVVHFLLLTTSKILIGVGIGLVLASYFWFAQPYWYFFILIGALILIPMLMVLMKDETVEERQLKREIGKIK
jgi:hypothetical protein